MAFEQAPADAARTILVVDDNPGTRYSTCRVLRAAGFGVVEAATGRDALAAVERGVDLAVLDVNLPDIDGFEVCRRIRASESGVGTAVVHLSASYVTDVYKVQGLQGGADGYLTHPVEPTMLVATVNAFLRTRSAEAAMRRSEAKFRAVFNNAITGICLLGGRLEFLEVNPALCRMLGQPAGALIGRRVTDLAPADARAAAESAERGWRHAGSWRGAFPLLCADGRRVEVEWNVSEHSEPGVKLAMATDITDRKQAEDDLRLNRRALQSVADNTPDFLARFDRRFRYVFLNRPLPGRAPLSSSDRLGKTNREMGMPADLCDRWESAMAGVFASGLPRQVEFELGARRLESRIVPELGSDGQVEHVLTVTRDVTEVRQHELALSSAKEAAERANAAKDQFLAVLSHELRTPLNPVLMAASELARLPSLPPQVRHDLEMIRRNVELEARLIDDLLDLTRVSRGKLDLRFAHVDLHEKARQVVRMVQAEASAKGVALSLTTAPLASIVSGDGARLQQILWNLLRNAIKFTPAGGAVRVETSAPGPGRLRIDVSDTGIGIDPRVLPRIFDAFEQGGPAVTRQFGGLGLGLAISRALAEVHGGQLRAHSEGRGLGATFSLELPLAEADAPTGEAAAKTPGPRRPLRILLVEDHPDTARIMGRLLQNLGHEVSTAGSVGAALQAAEEAKEKFDVVVSDLGLPDGSGHDLMRQLAARFPIKGIALSGYGMDEDVRRSGEFGFLAHLTKPVDLDRLQALIQEVAGN